jgi:hypothetical protein
MKCRGSWLGASAYHVVTYEKICSVVNELDRDGTTSGFCPALGSVISCVEIVDSATGVFVSHVC